MCNNRPVDSMISSANKSDDNSPKLMPVIGQRNETNKMNDTTPAQSDENKMNWWKITITAVLAVFGAGAIIAAVIVLVLRNWFPQTDQVLIIYENGENVNVDLRMKADSL